MKKMSFVLWGAVFGFLLSRAGATTFDFYAGLFLFRDLQLLWVICCAVAVGVVGIALLKRLGVASAYDRKKLVFAGKPMTRQLPFGAVLLGIGWGLAGACPGTAMVMLGEGKLAALFTVLGIALGTYVHGRTSPRGDSSSICA